MSLPCPASRNLLRAGEFVFLSDTHLPQILSPEAYYSREWYEQELEELFQPGWHCVGTTSDLGGDGGYFTLELFGLPLIVWQRDGEVHAFLNVCPHRFSLLATDGRGKREKLFCPYHGWEFDENGDTCKIPDSVSFRPLKKGLLCLKKFRAETIGQLVFVTLSEAAPSLKEYLGESFYGYCQNWFSDEWDQAFFYRRPNRSNWKISLENSLEGYHNATVHSATYEGWPAPDVCSHELHDGCRSTFKVNAEDEDDKMLTRLGKFAYGLAGVEPEFDFHEIHRYPNLVFAKFSKFTWVEIVIPTSPTDSYDLWYVFCRSGRGLRARVLSRAMRVWFKRFFTRILTEDENMFPAVQAGTVVHQRPGSGLISIREERIFHFQEYLQLGNGSPLETDRKLRSYEHDNHSRVSVRSKSRQHDGVG